MSTVHIAIGNSDDKLSQRRWNQYIQEAKGLVRRFTDTVYGVWYSAPDTMYQNCCISAEVPAESIVDLRMSLTDLRKEFDQDSIALNVSETEFV